MKRSKIQKQFSILANTLPHADIEVYSEFERLRDRLFNIPSMRFLPVHIERDLIALADAAASFVEQTHHLVQQAKQTGLSKRLGYTEVTRTTSFQMFELWLNKFQDVRYMPATDTQRIASAKRLLQGCVQLDHVLAKSTQLQDQFTAFIASMPAHKRAIPQRQLNWQKTSQTEFENMTALLQARLVHTNRKTTPQAGPALS